MTVSRLHSTFVALVCAAALLVSLPAFAGHNEEAPAKQAIVLAAFGTSYPEALKSILNIKTRVEKANPGTPVKLAFTSSIIRNIWQERQGDAAWQKANAGVPKDVLYVKSPLATVADLQNSGYKNIAVQSLHVFAGEEFSDLTNMMIGLRSIRALKAKSVPFKQMRLGRPALGMPGDVYPYTDDITVAVKALKADVDEAKKMNAALVYMGHGNDFFSTGIYAEFQSEMQKAYKHPVFVACVEGYPSFDDMLPGLKLAGKKNILLKPFMIVAGDHASNDMAGDEDDAWKVMLTKAGYKVKTDLRGLGMVDAWADIYVKHLKDALAQKHMLP
ncbi:sirohydrochlorin cobaltochelatase [uncultured Pseudodesulfovibrio sp.]|uniref:sirohydrochlorin cobaltochelatase n=1 Tax=uncultured Pseudodesulfovibrio sp. TaxID=2035858 RepID=UPI0029C63BAC|nr:sirohydrochlorin cobaltochelatase [uncultured Pseudodesulfovibrio sp.]